MGHYSSINNTTGVSNTSVGSNSLLSNITGSNNTCIGYDTGSSITYEINNTCLGSQSDISSGYTNSTAIGYKSKCTASNQIMLGTAAETVQIPGNLTTNGVFPISGSTLDLGSVSNTVSIPGTMNVGSSVTIGSENYGLTNYIQATNNRIVGTFENTFQSTANNFIGINSFTSGAVNINDVATFNSGLKCAKQTRPYNFFMGTAEYVSNSTGSKTLVPYIGDSTYGDSTAVYQLNQSIDNVQGMFISPNNTNICMWYVSIAGENQVNIACVNLTSGPKDLPDSIDYVCFATVATV